MCFDSHDCTVVPRTQVSVGDTQNAWCIICTDRCAVVKHYLARELVRVVISTVGARYARYHTVCTRKQWLSTTVYTNIFRKLTTRARDDVGASVRNQYDAERGTVSSSNTIGVSGCLKIDQWFCDCERLANEQDYVWPKEARMRNKSQDLFNFLGCSINAQQPATRCRLVFAAVRSCIERSSCSYSTAPRPNDNREISAYYS